jgi:uncharacterized protein YjdB
MSRESFVTAQNCPVRWKRLAKWREVSQTIDQLSEDRKALFKFINDLDFGGSYYATNDFVNSVSFDVSTLEIIEGDDETITATVLPANATDKTLTWKTSDASVATVADGVVTGVAAGTATITATANDGTKEKATCVVTVIEA